MKPDTYPKDLPSIPIYNDLETCLNCTYVTLLLPGEPDINHCRYMENYDSFIEKLTPKQKEEYKKIVTEVRCPLYTTK